MSDAFYLNDDLNSFCHFKQIRVDRNCPSEIIAIHTVQGVLQTMQLLASQIGDISEELEAQDEDGQIIYNYILREYGLLKPVLKKQLQSCRNIIANNTSIYASRFKNICEIANRILDDVNWLYNEERIQEQISELNGIKIQLKNSIIETIANRVSQ